MHIYCDQHHFLLLQHQNPHLKYHEINCLALPVMTIRTHNILYIYTLKSVSHDSLTHGHLFKWKQIINVIYDIIGSYINIHFMSATMITDGTVNVQKLMHRKASNNFSEVTMNGSLFFKVYDIYNNKSHSNNHNHTFSEKEHRPSVGCLPCLTLDIRMVTTCTFTVKQWKDILALWLTKLQKCD